MKRQKTNWNSVAQQQAEAFAEAMMKVKPTEAEAIRADAILKELNKWKKWKSFLKSGGVPGCRVYSKATSSQVADILATTGLDPNTGLPASSQTGAITTVNELINEDNAYSPDL